MGTGTITIVVIGGITWVKGNAGGLQNLAGLTRVPGGRRGAGQWIEFSTSNVAFAQVVVGVRSHDVATQLLLKGPLSLGHPRTLNGYAVDAIDGTQTSRARRSTSSSMSAPGAPTSRWRRTR